jgi:anti-anti-sigma regulatory factor
MTIRRYFRCPEPAVAGVSSIPICVLELLQPVGSLADDAVMEELNQTLGWLSAHQAQHLVVDFGQIPYFGSSLLEALRLISKSISERHGRMVCCQVSTVGREILQLAHFDRLWPIEPDRAAAMARLVELDSTGSFGKTAPSTEQTMSEVHAEITSLLQRYAAGPAQLRAALNGLTAEQLRTPVAPSPWSCLDVVCHISDFEIVYADRMKRVLVENQPTMFGGNPDDFSARLHYGQRDLETELVVIESIRRQVTRILSLATAADFDRTGLHSVDGPLSLKTLLTRIAGHIPHHLKFVEQKAAALKAS